MGGDDWRNIAIALTEPVLVQIAGSDHSPIPVPGDATLDTSISYPLRSLNNQGNHSRLCANLLGFRQEIGVNAGEFATATGQ